MFIKVDDLMNGNEFLWTKGKFLVRQSHMQEMYERFETTGSADVETVSGNDYNINNSNTIQFNL